MLRHLHLVAALLAAAGLAGCILLADKDAAKADDEPAKPATPSPLDAARVASAWQAKAVTMLGEHGKATDLFCLFTEGGWSDDGQVMVLAPAGAAPAQVVTVRPNVRDKSEAARDLQTAQWNAIKAQTSAAASLASIDVEAFDALTYEYVHFQKMPDGKVKDVKRVYVRNPGAKPMPEHDKLIKAFEALKAK